MKLLVTTDLSPLSLQVIPLAIEFGTLHSGSSLTFLFIGESSDANKTALQRLAENIPSQIKTDNLILPSNSSVAEEVVKFAKQNGYDLILLATHGRSGLARVLWGSVAEAVVKNATCPVALIPSEAFTSTVFERSDNPNILLLTDLQPESEPLYKMTNLLFEPFVKKGLTVTLFHAVEDIFVSSFHLSLGSDMEAIWEEREALANAKLEEVRDRFFPGKVVMSTAFRQKNNLADTLENISSWRAGSLLVLGHNKRKGVDGLVISSVAAHFLRTTTRPLLIVPL